MSGREVKFPLPAFRLYLSRLSCVDAFTAGKKKWKVSAAPWPAPGAVPPRGRVGGTLSRFMQTVFVGKGKAETRGYGRHLKQDRPAALIRCTCVGCPDSLLQRSCPGRKKNNIFPKINQCQEVIFIISVVFVVCFCCFLTGFLWEKRLRFQSYVYVS